MNKKKIIKIGLILLISGVVIGGSIVLYMFNMPHRDVQSARTDMILTTDDLVSEYLADATTANNKYLDEEGESKILEITGTVFSIGEDFNGNTEILLKSPDGKAGVSCAFTTETNAKAKNIKIGDNITVKGVIQSGASYDEDLEMYENVIMDKCDITKK